MNLFYHYSDKSISGNVFVDAHLSYRLGRYEFRFSYNYLFGNDSYERRVQAFTTDVYSNYQ